MSWKKHFLYPKKSDFLVTISFCTKMIQQHFLPCTMRKLQQEWSSLSHLVSFWSSFGQKEQRDSTLLVLLKGLYPKCLLSISLLRGCPALWVPSAALFHWIPTPAVSCASISLLTDSLLWSYNDIYICV